MRIPLRPFVLSKPIEHLRERVARLKGTLCQCRGDPALDLGLVGAAHLAGSTMMAMSREGARRLARHKAKMDAFNALADKQEAKRLAALGGFKSLAAKAKSEALAARAAVMKEVEASAAIERKRRKAIRARSRKNNPNLKRPKPPVSAAVARAAIRKAQAKMRLRRPRRRPKAEDEPR